MFVEPEIISFSVAELGSIITASACSNAFTCHDGNPFNPSTCDPNAQAEGGSYGGGAHN